jgi:hypothetical protein
MLATISRFNAVAVVGPLRLSGPLAWFLWLAVHLLYLVGFKNRLTVLVHWAVTFVVSSRSERTAPRANFSHHPARVGGSPNGNAGGQLGARGDVELEEDPVGV